MEVTSLFNLWLVTRQPLYWYDLEASLSTLTSEDAATAFIRGVYLWRSLSPESAIDAWQGAVNEYGAGAQSSLNALQAVGQRSLEPERAAAVGQIRAILDLESP
jgi:hypothetical protein